MTTVLRDAGGGLTATEAAADVGISRITARRYLEHLVDSGRAARAPSTARSAARNCAIAGRAIDRS